MRYKATERAWVMRLLARLTPEQRARYEATVQSDAYRHHHSGKIYDIEKARIAEQILLEDARKRTP